MSRDSLSRLIARSFGLAAVIQPVLPSRFEPIDSVPLPGPAGLGLEAAELTEMPSTQVPRVYLVDSPIRAFVPLVQAETEASQAPHRPKWEDANAAFTEMGRFVEATGPVLSPLAAPRPGLPSPDATVNTLANRQPPDESLPRRQSDQMERLRTPVAVTATAARPRVALPVAPGGEAPTARPAGQGRPEPTLVPAEIRVRESGPAPPKQDATAVDGRSASSARDASPDREMEGSVTVHIGRIEVRAVMEPARGPDRKQPVDDRQRLTLSEYLKQREKGAR